MPHASRHIVRWLMPSSWQMVPGVLWLLVGIDLRRPASWISLAMGGWLGWWSATRAPADSGIALVSAAALAVAAIGDLPLSVCGSAGRRLPLLWACERAVWPLVGTMLGIVAAGSEVEPFAAVSAVMVGTLLASVTTVMSRLSGAKAADAASLTMLLAAASVSAGVGLRPWLGGGCAGAAAAWLLLGGLGWAWSRSQQAAFDAVLPGMHRTAHVAGSDVLHVDAFPANGPLRQMLTRLAMVLALAAMAGWLVLEPAVDSASGGGRELAGPNVQWGRLTQVHRAAMAWALFTAAWFVGLAVPQATLQDGMAGAGAWDRLFRSASGPHRVDARSRRLSLGPRPGPVRFAGGVALSQAAILGWPVLVCAVLALPSPAAARLPLGIVLGLAAAAAVVTATVLLGITMKASRETMFAAAMAIAVGLLASTTGSTYVAGEPVQPVQPALPKPPSLVPRLLHGLRGG